jgi:O-antigen ligase/polysaccharide polymerase Wzy-like membrane protein
MNVTSPSLQYTRVTGPSWTLLGLLLVIDEMLLPTFHLGGLPYKISYFICGLWLVDAMVRTERDARSTRLFVRFAVAMSVIVGCALLGELWLAAVYEPVYDGQASRSVLIYVLATLAFGMGLSAGRFRFEWLVPVMFVAVGLNVLTIVMRASLPAWLTDLYFPEQLVTSLADHGATDARSILEMVRPRGLFGNPNVSAHMVTVIALFICLGLRNGRMAPPRPLVAIGVVALPMMLATLLASRGEMLVSALLALLNFRYIFRLSNARARAQLTLAAVVAPLLLIAVLVRVISDVALIENWDRFVRIFDALQNSSQISTDEQSLSGLSRPLLTLQRMWDRFQFSPLFGAGFSATLGPPFEAGTEFFHNDWFRVLATSGLAGFAAMLWIIRVYCLRFGWMALIPFVLPALVNTFMLLIPAFLFYFFMIGVLHATERPAPEPERPTA